MKDVNGLSAKEAAEKRRLDRKIFNGKGTRADIHRGLELLDKREAALARTRTIQAILRAG
jgi:hypothetical protein